MTRIFIAHLESTDFKFIVGEIKAQLKEQFVPDNIFTSESGGPVLVRTCDILLALIEEKCITDIDDLDRKYLYDEDNRHHANIVEALSSENNCHVIVIRTTGHQNSPLIIFLHLYKDF